MKQINIIINIFDGKIETTIKQNFVDTAETVHTLIGCLENLKSQELEKLKNSAIVISKNEKVEK